MPKCRFCERNNPAGIDRCQNCGAWLEQTENVAPAQQPAEGASSTDDFEAQILSLVRQDQMIAAIKLYRERTGCGLADAKSAVEALAARWQIGQGSPEADGISPESLEGQVLVLMSERKKIEAIRLYRQKNRVGLKEAKDAVEALAVKYGVNPKAAGCAGMILLMIAIASVFIYSLI